MKCLTFLLAVICFVLTNVSLILHYALFSNMPQVMEEMFNSSFHQHYGSYLGSFGMSTIWSASLVSSTVGRLIGIIFLTPLLESKGSKFVSVYLRLIFITSVSALQLAAYFLPSFEAFILSWLFHGMIVIFGAQAVIFYLNEIASSYKAYFAVLICIGDTLGRLVMMNLSRPILFGSSTTWFYIPITAFLASFVPTLYLHFLPNPHKDMKKQRARTITYGTIDPDVLLRPETKPLIVHEGVEEEIKTTNVLRERKYRKVLLIMLALGFFYDCSPKAVELSFFTRLHQTLGFGVETIMTIGSIQRVIFLPIYLLSVKLIKSKGTLFSILVSNYIMLFWSGLIFTGMMTVQFLGASWFSRTIGILGDICSGLTSCFGGIVLLPLIMCEITPPKALVAMTQITSLVSLLVDGLFQATLPYAFRYSPPSAYLFLLLTFPPLLFFLHRNRSVYRKISSANKQ